MILLHAITLFVFEMFRQQCASYHFSYTLRIWRIVEVIPQKKKTILHTIVQDAIGKKHHFVGYKYPPLL